MSDPFGRAYVTAGDAFVAADGLALNLVPGDIVTYRQQYGEDAALVWAETRNRDLLASGSAIQTPQGVVSYENARFAVQKAGYNGPTDAASIATAYGMLATPAPAPPSPASHQAAAAALGGVGLGSLSSVPKPLIYAGLALIAYEMFFKRGHR